ncbi:MAG: hypothetical protein KBC34_11390 [Phenylobacterium sp.]|nr:hypothetical protein [Phenylobacterium sp.]
MQQTFQRTAYLVLGMHRSGTSATAQLLALAGAELPDNVMPGDEHNAKGYFEPWKISVFNDQRLRAAASAWDDPFNLPYAPLDPEAEADWTTRAVDLFRAEFGESIYPLLKDPRVSVLLPMWRAALERLDMPARVVIPVRHPLAVAGSLARRDAFPVEKSVLVWTLYMLAAEAGSRDLPRAFVSYDGLLADWRAEVARMEQALGAPLPRLTEHAADRIDGFLTKDLRHNDGMGALADVPMVGAMAQEVLDWFTAAAAGETPDRAPLERAAAQIAQMKSQMGVLVTPVTSTLDSTRAELLYQRQLGEVREQQIKALERDLAILRQERAKIEAMVDTALAGR